MLRRHALPAHILTLMLLLAAATAVAQEAPHPVHAYFFWGEGCPYCTLQKTFLEGLVADHPNVVVHAFEVYFVEENRAVLMAMAAAFGRDVRGVPMTFIGDEVWVGYSDALGRQMRAAVERYQAYEAPDPADRLSVMLRDRVRGEAAP